MQMLSNYIMYDIQTSTIKRNHVHGNATLKMEVKIRDVHCEVCNKKCYAKINNAVILGLGCNNILKSKLLRILFWLSDNIQ